MSQTIRYCILILFIMAIIFSAGCIVPTKDKPAPAGTQSEGTNYLVPGTGSAPAQQSQDGNQNQAAPGQSPTHTPIPDDTRYLTQVPTYPVTSDNGPVYRNLSIYADPTQIIRNYQDIYNNELSLKDYTVAYAYDLKNPPLIIDFNVKPKMDDLTIWSESRSGSLSGATTGSGGGFVDPKRADVYTQVTQLSPDAWFEIKVLDKTTGNVVLDEGFGRTFGGELKKTVSVRSFGNYQIEMSGNKVNVSVRMYIINGTA
ncbi:MAG: hypothetical protein WCJ93_02210 [Methanomicrobiales archaeon]